MRITFALLFAACVGLATFSTVLVTAGCATTSAAGKADDESEAKQILSDLGKFTTAFALCAEPDLSATIQALRTGNWGALWQLATCIPAAAQAVSSQPAQPLPAVANLRRAQAVYQAHLATLVIKQANPAAAPSQ
jgi:hypothetical protein